MKAQLLQHWENSRAYTLSVAELMPETAYDLKPVDEVWSFGEQLNHITYGIHWWSEMFIRKVETEWAPPKPKTGKKTIIAALEKAYDALKKTYEESSGKEDGLYTTLDHITHHRGQLIVYLRLKGIQPPEYVY
ncbi:DinB family protein [Chitinophaga sp. SYP-B3965]|uniref:DinB family protein n=1 Tax=Chitinophaga sp. SYP-B3965 TaxID=2663120 RepID=UPI001299ED48|nr:DinB family protein [Chitinophaga sp. SYP-B3965]MRG44771.1 DinB family protein [Chitinophaga sp. SYP-B3965]